MADYSTLNLPTTGMPSPSDNAGVVTGGTNSTIPNVPNWYGQLGQGFANTIGGALNTVGNLTSNWYNQPLYAAPTGAQIDALTSAQQNLDNYGQNFQGANTALANVGTAVGNGGYANKEGTAAGNMTAGLETGQNTLGTASQFGQSAMPNFGNASNVIGSAANNLQGMQGFTEQGLQQQLNPYLSNVMGNIQTLGNRNLMENVIPGLNSTFVGAGQFGSSRNNEFMNRALRDNQQGISMAQGNAMDQAYGQAAQNQLNWNQQGLQQQGALTAAGQALTGVGQGQTSASSNLANIGSQQATLPANIYGQQAGAYGNTGALIGQQQNMQNQAQLAQAQAQQQAALQQQQLYQNGLTGMYNMGQQAQTSQQAGLDRGYQDYLNQINVPIGALSTLSGADANSTLRFGTGSNSSTLPNTAPPSGATTAGGVLSGLGTVAGYLPI